VIQIKRMYDAPEADDGFRILVDRLWPQGISKERAALDEWAKEIAPSPELRVWFGHDPAKFTEFSKRYTTELRHNPATSAFVKKVKAHPSVTLLFAAKDPKVNHAAVLLKFLRKA
jgi:uncharacterized protein YeaO (DUF488 family)